MRQINRRALLQHSSQIGFAALACTALKPLAAWANPLGLPIGIQLFAVRSLMQTDTPGVLKQLYEIGYREVEPAGFGKYSAKEFGQLIRDAGLTCPSAHLQLGGDDLGPVFDDAHALGITYATSSNLSSGAGGPRPPATPGIPPAAPRPRPPLGMDGFKKLAAKMNEVGTKAKAASLRYAYHNGTLEFEKLPDGSFGYDILLKESDKSLVTFELDCGAMAVSGADPVEYMQKYPGRFRMFHIKDFKAIPVGDARPEGCELGTGFIDYKPIFAKAKTIGIEHQFAEQEAPYTKPEMDSAKINYAYLHSFN